jgi:hypothetical protein
MQSLGKPPYCRIFLCNYPAGECLGLCDFSDDQQQSCKSLVYNPDMTTLSWKKLNDVLHSLDEAQVLQLLNEEQAGAKRSSALTRLHQRYSILRTARERKQLFRDIMAQKDATTDKLAS